LAHSFGFSGSEGLTAKWRKGGEIRYQENPYKCVIVVKAWLKSASLMLLFARVAYETSKE